MKEFLSPDIFYLFLSCVCPMRYWYCILLGLKEQTGYMAGRENCMLEALLKS